MKITEHFDSAEFNCKDGTLYPTSWIVDRLIPLCAALEVLRDRVGAPIVVLSGYRTPEWNKRVGGASKSKHMEGIAADIQVHGMQASELHAIVLSQITLGRIPQGGVGLYPLFVHYDMRGTAVRWYGSRGLAG